MDTKYSSKASLFLMELIIAVLFFSISSAICTQLFVKSHIISQQTVSENHTVLWVQNISEVFLSNNGNFQTCKDIFHEQASPDCHAALSGLTEAYDDNMCFLFNQDWNTTKDLSTAKYMVLALFSTDQTFHYIDICALQIPSPWASASTLDERDERFSNITNCSDLSELLEQQQIWHYYLQVKSYSGSKGEDSYE